MCPSCFYNDKISTYTTFTVDLQNGIIVVRNVPCLECPVCGEETFTDDVSAKLETIVQTAKSIMQDISVIDYSRVA